MNDQRAHSARGCCPHCGHTTTVNKDGLTRRHHTRRVQTGPGGRPEIYRTETHCPGSGQHAEPIGELVAELHRRTPRRGERAMTVTQITSERTSTR